MGILVSIDEVSVKDKRDTSIFTLLYIQIVIGMDVSTLVLLMPERELVDQPGCDKFARELAPACMGASMGSESRTANRRDAGCDEDGLLPKESCVLALDRDRRGVAASSSLHDFRRGKSGCELRTMSPIGCIR